MVQIPFRISHIKDSLKVVSDEKTAELIERLGWRDHHILGFSSVD